MVGVGLLRTELGFGNLGFTGRLGLGLNTMGAMMMLWFKTFLFCKSFPPQPFFFLFRTDYMIPQTFTVTSSTSVFYFFCSTLFSCRFRAVD